MTHLALLLGMSLTDSIFTGYRAAAGRNPLIHKLDYTLASCWTGFFAGLGGALVAAAAALVYLYRCTRRGQSVADVIATFDAGAQPLAHSYGVFATGVLLVVIFWTYPRRRTRELAVVLILGPCTLLRPYWIVGGAIWALLHVDVSLSVLIVFVALVQLSIEPLLDRWQLRAQRLRMREWL